MEQLYRQTIQLLNDIQNHMSKYEVASSHDAQQILQHIHSLFENVNSNVQRVEILVNKEQPVRRQNAKLRLNQLKYDRQHLEAALRNLQYRRLQREEQERQREQLMLTNFQTNESENTSVVIDHTLQHHTHLQNANREMDVLLDSGSSILGSLRDQRGTLKGVQKRLFDIANTLGLSNTVMRLIERRTYQDKFILYGGMIVTCVIMFLTVKYLV